MRNALQTELPHLISTEFSSSQENEPSIAHSSEAGPTGKTVSEEHVARWRSLFLQMERTLQEEGRHLVSLHTRIFESLFIRVFSFVAVLTHKSLGSFSFILISIEIKLQS